jgi:hypothetical protein
MTTDQKLDQMLTLLTGFIAKQEAFNENQLAFNTKQEAFNNQTTVNFARLDRKIDQMYDEFLSFQKNEEIQHGVTHKLIMQAFAHITELQAKQPWQA